MSKNTKYEFTGETKVIFGVTLKQIRAISAIASIFVNAGDIGGWIESEKNLDVSGDAWVSGNARVSGNAWVSGDAWVIPVPYIQGSRHALTLFSLAQIRVGCHVHDISHWLKHYKAIGHSEGYTKEQVEEYGEHLAYIAKIAERLRAKNDTKTTA